MRAEDLDQAIALANATPFGLTSGIQTLDDREIARWVDRIDAGTLYVNRPITGAIVGRQPFGGWKASSVGPGAKAGGPNYVLQLGRWRQVTLPSSDGEPLPEPLAELLERCLAELRDADSRALVRASAASYAARVATATSAASTIPARSSASGTRSATDRAGASSCGEPPRRRHALAGGARGLRRGGAADGEPRPGLPARGVARRVRGARLVVEAEAGFVERLAHPDDAERVRVWEPISTAARAAANGVGLTVIDAPCPRQRAARAPLVPPGADGLAGPPPLRQRHGARRCRVTARRRPRASLVRPRDRRGARRSGLVCPHARRRTARRAPDRRAECALRRRDRASSLRRQGDGAATSLRRSWRASIPTGFPFRTTGTCLRFRWSIRWTTAPTSSDSSAVCT